MICPVGLLVEAMRKGSWIILDELNLAPTDVLEALNRVCVQLCCCRYTVVYTCTYCEHSIYFSVPFIAVSG